jgi:hypothetical protein
MVAGYVAWWVGWDMVVTYPGENKNILWNMAWEYPFLKGV